MMTIQKTKTDIKSLVAQAWAVRKNAYSPYYGYPVGSALLSQDGRIFVGCNVENAAGAALACAETTALGSAIASGARKFKAIAIAGPINQFLLPCGNCRQKLMEFSPGMDVYASKKNGAIKRYRLRDLLPNTMSIE